MIPILSIVGRSDSGKTLLIETLVSALKEKGTRIATVKHDVHGFDIDREGKDRWRHKQAGACTVVLSSPTKIAMIKDVREEQDLERKRGQWITDVDLIVTEGYKRADDPKVEVALFGDSDALLCSGEDGLVAVVTNREIIRDVPVLRRTELKAFVDWFEQGYLRNG
jgi:molybdopterin-guanine dinucleotide biosynthesis protein B